MTQATDSVSDGPPSDREVRPEFSRGYPAHPELDALVASFGRGDFRHVREAAPRLARASEEDAVRAAALDLRRRLEPSWPPLVLLALGVALALFAFGFHRVHPAP